MGPWGWRNLLKIRNEARAFLKFKVGDGHRIFLWQDNWHPAGILCQTFGHRIIYDAESSFDAKVDNDLRNGEWYWPPARSEDLVTIQSQPCLVHIKVSDQLTGLLQLVVNLCVLLPGIRSEAEVQKWIGGNYYGFLKPSLNIASLLLKIG